MQAMHSQAKNTGLAKLLGAVSRGALRLRQGRDQQSLELLETLSLGGRRQLMLVRCGDQQFLVGASHDAVTAMQPIGAAVQGTSLAFGQQEQP